MISPTRFKTSPRFGAGTSRHLSNADLAALIASFTSTSFERGKSPIKSSLFAGFLFSEYLPDEGSIHFPLTKFRIYLPFS
jgi:hypothetical protein